MNIRRGSVLSLALLLTSCGAIPTQYVPNGYRYNDNTPLSSPPPTRPWLDEAAKPNLDHLGDNTAAWQGAIYELISPLPAIIPPANGPVSVKAAPPASMADASFDHYLRQGLISYGYAINPVAEDTGVILEYNAEALSKPAVLKKAQAKFGKEFVSTKNLKDMYYLTLKVKSNKMTITEQATIGVIPHEKDGYMRWPGFGYTPTQGRAPKQPVYNTRD